MPACNTTWVQIALLLSGVGATCWVWVLLLCVISRIHSQPRYPLKNKMSSGTAVSLRLRARVGLTMMAMVIGVPAETKKKIGPI